jgi:hypothetical protein
MHRFSAIVASVLSVSALSISLAPPAFAQDAAELEMADFQFSSVITADNVYVRSGSSESDYPVVKLSKGDIVIAVGRKFDWVKILPPENTYCLVGKAWIEKRGDGTVGRVRDESANVNVRLASNLNNMITKVGMQLHGGADVKILGEQDEYFKIAPPAGTFMWVHQKFVEPVKRVEVVSNNGQLEVRPLDPNAAATTPANTTSGTPADTTGEVASTTGQQPDTSTGAATPDNTTVASTDTPGPTTVPAATVAAGEKEFDALETRFDEASKLPLEQQPLDELLTGYEKVVAAKQIPESMLRLAEFRVKGLKIRKEALAQMIETRDLQAKLAAEAKPLVAEGGEITQRLEEARIKQFSAVGTLRQSALPYGGRTLYRLTDPATGRTVVYVNTDDANVIKLEGMFIGIRGEVTEDTNRRIKFIQPREVEQVDPAGLVKGSITSTLTPPSLLPSSASAKPE